MTRRRRNLAIGALAVVAGAALVYRLAGERPAARSGRTDGPAREAAPRDVPVRVFPDPAQEQHPGVHCWDGLLELDRAGTLDGFRDLLARAVDSGDDLLAAYIQDRLAELVGGDVARAMQLLDWAEGAEPRELEILLGALQKTAAVQDRSVAERLLAMGEDATRDETRRAAALTALETQHHLDADTLGRLRAVALDESAEAAAWTATRTVGRVMKEDFTRTGTYAPYWEQLLEIGRASADPAVRLLALEMPAYADPILGSRYIDELAQILMTAPEREVREMAAFQLGVTEDADRVLAVFRAAFPKEKELCVRWAMFRFSVRAAGPRALPVLAELARLDRRFRPDLEDFQRIYASGVQDFERVWLEKPERHACGVDEGAHE